MNKSSINVIVKSAIIAALYAAMTYLFAPLSYGNIQFRLSEILIILVVFNPKYIIGLTIGCFIANIGSTMVWDMLFGTLATLLSLLLMTRFKNLYLACLFPVVINGLIVGFELWWLLELPFGLSMLEVMFGEACVLYLIGIPIMTNIANKPNICEILELHPQKEYLKSNLYPYIGLTIMMALLFFFMPYSVEETSLAIVDIALDNLYMFSVVAFFGILIINYFNKIKLFRMIVLAICLLGILAFFIVATVINPIIASSTYYYLIIFILLLYGFIIYKLN